MAGTLLKNGVRTSFVQSLINQVRSRQSRFYYTVGQVSPWDIETIPPFPIDDASYENFARTSMVFAKLIDAAGVSAITRRIDWEFGRTYDFYDDKFTEGVAGASTLREADFYVLNSQFNVYKCLSNNNNRASVVEPSGVDPRPFTTADGYTWKYIYTINPALRNKFLTSRYMPISNPVLLDYYKKGSINNVSIRNQGSGYIDPPGLTVIGDGFLEENPLRITQASLDSGGSGYTTLVGLDTRLSDPFPITVPYTAQQSVLLGEIVVSGLNYYRVDKAGVLPDFAPTHTQGTVAGAGDEANLTYVATRGTVESFIDAEQIGSVFITNSGFGYTNPPNVDIVGGGGTGAIGLGFLSGSSVQEVQLSDFGSGYSTQPTAVFEEPVLSYTVFSPNLSVVANQTIKTIVSDVERYYTVVSSGALDSSPPDSESTSNFLNGTATIRYIAKRAAGEPVRGRITEIELKGFIGKINLLAGGSGYAQGTTLVQFQNINGGEGSGASAVAIVEGGVITALNLVSPGQDYVPGKFQIVITGDGTGAAATADVEYGFGYSETPQIIFSNPNETNGVLPKAEVSAAKTEAIIEAIIENGSIVGVNIVNGGVGYTFATITVANSAESGADLVPIIDFGDILGTTADSQLLAVAGTVSGSVVTNRGVGYTTATVQIIGNGTGATAVANIVNGEIDSIVITNPGQSYTFAEVSIIGDGVGATARAILSPPRGHGYDPIEELYSSAVAFFTSLSIESNQGVFVDNEYRQICILRDPFDYGRQVITQNALQSACFLVGTNFQEEVELFQDDVLTKIGTGSQFKIVEINNSTFLLSSLDNGRLEPDDVIGIVKNGVSYQFQVLTSIEPQLDKYTGELIFIDNVRSFKFSGQQFISIRSVVELD